MGLEKTISVRESLNTVEELTNRMMEVAGTIRGNPAMLARIQGSLERRKQICIKNNGGDFKQLLRMFGQKLYN